MSVHTYIAKKGTKFHYDDNLVQIEIESLNSEIIVEDAFSDKRLVPIDGDDFMEFFTHLMVKRVKDVLTIFSGLSEESMKRIHEIYRRAETNLDMGS